MVIHTHNLSTREAETEGSRFQGQPTGIKSTTEGHCILFTLPTSKRHKARGTLNWVWPRSVYKHSIQTYFLDSR